MESRVLRIENALDFSTSLAKERSKNNGVRSFKRFIEHSNWDERILSCEKWVDGFCWGFIVLSIICLLPTIVHILQ